MTLTSGYAIHIAHDRLWLHHLTCGAAWIDPFEAHELAPDVLFTQEIQTAITAHERICRTVHQELGAA